MEDVRKTGIGAHTYQKRGEILSCFYNTKPNEFLSHIIELCCVDNVGNLILHLFKNSPTYTEEYACSECNTIKQKAYVSFIIPMMFFTTADVADAITEMLGPKLTKCPTCANAVLMEQHLGMWK